jgi:hypothetical protein
MCELVWGELGKFVDKRQVRRKHPPFIYDDTRASARVRGGVREVRRICEG